MKQHALLLATWNQGKLNELRQLLADLRLTICDLSSFPAIQPVAETGETFLENARLKAVGYATQTKLLTLADDSGLEVDALDGAPGVRSARYAHEGASDAQRANKLLSELSCVPPGPRRARFVSVIAIADQKGQVIHVSRGTCEGRIAEAPRGSNGFGYDPIFIPEGLDQTFAELQAEVKNSLSHRSRAIAGAHQFLRGLTVSSDAG